MKRVRRAASGPWGAPRPACKSRFDIMMPGIQHHDVRTTVTIDEDVARRLEAERRRTGKAFREVVNECLRRGLASTGGRDKAPPFEVDARDLGGLRPGLSLDSIGDLLEAVEGPLHR